MYSVTETGQSVRQEVRRVTELSQDLISQIIFTDINSHYHNQAAAAGAGAGVGGGRGGDVANIYVGGDTSGQRADCHMTKYSRLIQSSPPPLLPASSLHESLYRRGWVVLLQCRLGKVVQTVPLSSAGARLSVVTTRQEGRGEERFFTIHHQPSGSS